MTIFFRFLFLSLLSFNLVAHEGHDHTPGRKDAPNGGVVKETPSYHFEMVESGKDLMLFVYDVNMKPIEEIKKISLSAYTQLPRQEKKPLEMGVMGNHFHGQFDKGSAHRFDLLVNVQDQDKTVELKWVID